MAACQGQANVCCTEGSIEEHVEVPKVCVSDMYRCVCVCVLRVLVPYECGIVQHVIGSSRFEEGSLCSVRMCMCICVCVYLHTYVRDISRKALIVLSYSCSHLVLHLCNRKFLVIHCARLL